MPVEACKRDTFFHGFSVRLKHSFSTFVPQKMLHEPPGCSNSDNIFTRHISIAADHNADCRMDAPRGIDGCWTAGMLDGVASLYCMWF